MTRDELIEAMARAGIRAGMQSDELARCVAAFMLTAIKAQGLAIVPVEVTDAQADEMLDTGLVEDGVPGKSAYECAQIVYRAMIKSGKL